MDDSADRTRHVRRLVAALGLASLVAILAALVGAQGLAALRAAPISLGASEWLVACALAALLFALQRQGFVFHWRGQSTKVSLDEIGLLLGLLVLAPAHVALAVFASSALTQAVHRRSAPKALFNVSQYTFAALAAVAAAATLRAMGVPSPWYAAAAPIVFSPLTTLLVSLVFSRLEDEPVMRVFARRFGAFVLVGVSVGVSLGIVIWALYLLHPVAVLAAVPIFLYLRRFGRLSEWADDELTTHRLVASVGAEVAGREDLDEVADRILRACEKLIDCGEASLTLTAEGDAPRVWRRSCAPALGYGGVAAEIAGPDGTSRGSMSAFPKAGQRRYGEREHQLLRTVAASAAAAAANADALQRAREANRELAASEERYRSFFDTAHLLIHVLDENGRILDQNAAAQQALGWSEEDVRAVSFDEMVCPDDPPLFARLKKEGEVIGVETRLRSPGGDSVHALLDARALAGSPSRYVVFSRDITPLKALEAELRHSMARQHETIKRLENMNHELEEFTLWTTHDMREPLRSIGTIASFLNEDLGRVPVEEARDMTRRIAQGAEKLKERVKALHAFSLIVQRDDEFEDVDMHRVVQDVLAGLETRIAEKGAVIEIVGGRLPTVRAQPHRIDQVFGNLVENALKYGVSPAPIVQVGAIAREDEWRFFVRDNGPGIPAGYQERVFQLFQRGPGSTEAGSGAGLAIVKRIAEQHGGRAWVETGAGEGACFFVSIPRAAPAQTPSLPGGGAARKRF